MFRSITPQRKQLLLGAIAVYLISITTYLAVVARERPQPVIFQYQGVAHSEIPEGEFKVPYYFDYLEIPPSTRERPILVGHLQGSGVVQSMAFQAQYYGIAIGYSVDGKEICWINNGHCLKEWNADSVTALDMPVRLLRWNGKYDLGIGVHTPIKYDTEFKLYFLNSHASHPYAIRSLHLYGYFRGLRFGEGNQLKL